MYCCQVWSLEQLLLPEMGGTETFNTNLWFQDLRNNNLQRIIWNHVFKAGVWTELPTFLFRYLNKWSGFQWCWARVPTILVSWISSCSVPWKSGTYLGRQVSRLTYTSGSQTDVIMLPLLGVFSRLRPSPHTTPTTHVHLPPSNAEDRARSGSCWLGTQVWKQCPRQEQPRR